MFESLTLSQTKRIDAFPIILYGTEYWKGLIDWMKNTLVANETINKDDFALFSVVDTPEQVRFLINEHHPSIGDMMRKQKRRTGKKKK